jgi:acyl carrier protein
MSLELEQKFTQLVAEQIGDSADEIHLNDRFDDLGLDSLDVVELVMEAEEVFKLTIPDDDVEPLETVRDFTAYLEKRVPEWRAKL